MGTCYIELRKVAARGTESAVADMMRHLHARQHLGSTLIVCERPDIILPTARKQWMKLGRSVQKQRASTLNADKILKYTHTIIHMQNMRFSTADPHEEPGADAYFLTGQKPDVLPSRCYTVYVHAQLTLEKAGTMVQHLPADALIIDYLRQPVWDTLGLAGKSILEEHARSEWQRVRQFLEKHHVHIAALPTGKPHHIEAMDDALDTLLNTPHIFLRVANDFQHALELARPIRTAKELRLHYDAVMLLAHRVQTLTMPAFHQQFLESYNEDDTFFLYDDPMNSKAVKHIHMQEVISGHKAAGRHRLANALQMLANDF